MAEGDLEESEPKGNPKAIKWDPGVWGTLEVSLGVPSVRWFG